MARPQKDAGELPAPITDLGALPAILTIDEAAALLRIHPTTAKDWCRAGKLPGAFKLAGKEWRVRRDELLRAIGAGGQAASDPARAE